tara:strand:+ start:135 stop:401 length:267 start_codon:yes stop_codon:yes gene_type:complete
VIDMPEVTMSIEEYLALIDQSNNKKQIAPPGMTFKATVKPKRKGTPDPKMAKALKMANERARKKNGGYKKGFDQSKLMSLAHKLRRKM